MKLKSLASLRDSVFLAMNGVVSDYEAGAALSDERRAALVETVQQIKAEERTELIRAIAKGIGG